MNYQKIYNQLIIRAKARSAILGYTETHHVVPRCLGGTDDPTNLVDLTPEEHYVAHQLLVKLHKGNKKILSAAVIMCSNRVNNKLYGWLRRRFSEAQSRAMAGSGNNMFDKRWVSNEYETKLVEAKKAQKLLDSGNYIAGKIAVRSPCGCLVKKRCIKHSNLKKIAYDTRRRMFKQQAKDLFNEFIQSDVKSVTQFAKLKNTSQPALTQLWKKHVPEYSAYVTHGKSFKQNLTLK